MTAVIRWYLSIATGTVNSNNNNDANATTATSIAAEADAESSTSLRPEAHMAWIWDVVEACAGELFVTEYDVSWIYVNRVRAREAAIAEAAKALDGSTGASVRVCCFVGGGKR